MHAPMAAAKPASARQTHGGMSTPNSTGVNAEAPAPSANAWHSAISIRSNRPEAMGASAGGAWRIGLAERSKAAASRYTRRRTSVPLVPPKPKLFFTATLIFMSRAVLAQ